MFVHIYRRAFKYPVAVRLWHSWHVYYNSNLGKIKAKLVAVHVSISISIRLRMKINIESLHSCILRTFVRCFTMAAAHLLER